MYRQDHQWCGFSTHAARAACVHYLVGKKSINRSGKCHSGLARQEISKIYACCPGSMRRKTTSLTVLPVLSSSHLRDDVLILEHIFFSVHSWIHLLFRHSWNIWLLATSWKIWNQFNLPTYFTLSVLRCFVQFQSFMQCVLTCEFFREITKFSTRLSSFNISFLPVS